MEQELPQQMPLAPIRVVLPQAQQQVEHLQRVIILSLIEPVKLL